MIGNNIKLILFILVELLVCRGYIEAMVICGFTKKEQKEYKCSTSALNRWLLWSTYRMVKDKYSKSERKIIKYTSIFKICRVINVILHLDFIVALMLGLTCSYFDGMSNAFIHFCYTSIALGLLAFVILAIIEIAYNRQYHKSRYRR